MIPSGAAAAASQALKSHVCEITIHRDAQDFTNVPEEPRAPRPGETLSSLLLVDYGRSNLLRYDLNGVP